MFFYVGLSLLIIHEMDAIRCKEWRLFPGLSLLNDKLGFMVFTIAHIPLFVWLLHGLSKAGNDAFITGLNYFFVIHFGLHLLFLMHKKNEFKDWFSWIFISGAAACGLVNIFIY